MFTLFCKIRTTFPHVDRNFDRFRIEPVDFVTFLTSFIDLSNLLLYILGDSISRKQRFIATRPNIEVDRCVHSCLD